MAVRIYTLAKELKLDSKVLADLCTKAGITGKGSALASLTDDEVEKLKAYLAASSKQAAAQPPRAAAPAKPVPPPSRPPVLTGKPPILTGKPPILAGRATATPAAQPESGPAQTGTPAQQRMSPPPEPAAPAAGGPRIGSSDRRDTAAAPPDSAASQRTTYAPQPAATSPTFTAPSSPAAAASLPGAAASPLGAASLPGAAAPLPLASASPTASAPTPPPAAGALAEVPAPTARGGVEPAQTRGRTLAAPAAVAAPVAGSSPTPSPEGTQEAPVSPRPPHLALTKTGRPPVLKARGERAAGESAHKAAEKPPRPSGPAIRLATLPPTSAPPTPQKSTEPPPQKPDLKLPADVVRASKLGGKPLQALVQKHEDRRKAEAARAKAAPEPRKPAGERIEPVPEPSGRDRKRSSRAVALDESLLDTALGGREARQLNRKRQAEARRQESGDEDQPIRQVRVRTSRSGRNTAAPRKGKAVVELPCTVRSLSEAIGVPTNQILYKLLTMGSKAAITSNLEPETIELLCAELGVEVELKQPQDAEAALLASLAQTEDDPAQLVPRPPVVTFLGHVDHGKTSLLDRIIGIDVASRESGGITQHIRAYRIEKEGRPITFVDTPGHEAFTEMRARGANVTDIAVLVVAADDGVMPQTEEAISHARAAGVPIVVALNKIDLPGINYDRIYSQLVTAGLQPSEWGGDTELVRCSARTGEGIDKLLETLLTLAELHDYRANPAAPARGTCLEAEVHEGRGVVAKILVQRGTLRVGDVLFCGPAYGRVKAMYDTLAADRTWEEAPPGTPVNLMGLNEPPGAGDAFYVVDDISVARSIAEKHAQLSRQEALAGRPRHLTLETLHQRLGGESVQTLNLILRADVRGSIEAIQKELTKLRHPEVQIRVLLATVGGITEGDVHLAHASDAVIIGFNVVPDERARQLAERLGVQIRRYDIIYQVADDLKLALEGMLKPEMREVELGRALVLQLFNISRVGTVAGCRVLAGTVERNARVRLIRDSRVIGDYAIESLRHEKNDVREIREGYECGIKLAGFNDLKEGDILEAYRVEQVARTL